MLLSKSKLLWLITSLLVSENAAKTTTNQLSRRLEVVNDSGESLEVDWLNPKTGEAVHFSTIQSSAPLDIDSFVNHTFIIRSTKNETSASSSCSNKEADNQNEEAAKECRTATYVTVSEDKEQIIVVKEGLEVERKKSKIADKKAVSNKQAHDIVYGCRLMADIAVSKGKSADTVLKDLSECLESKTASVIEVKNEELAFHADLRLKVSAIAENYTCADPNMVTSTPKEERTWTHKGVERKVGILHDRPGSQIHILHNFISREECDAIEKAAKPTLHRGTVADGKGGSKLSENRKAFQAGLKINWEKEEEGDLIAAVDRRLFDYTNHVTGYNMTVDGQEDLMSIQYFGNGVDDPTPDRYMPHCDGDCDGLPHKTGGRVATIVMYCDVPELGGGTNFQNSNVFVKPQAGAAAFFSYMDPKTLHHETGFTTHSGCPVLKGTKRIAVQWMRVGVDAENPWDSFDTNTIKKGFYNE